MPLICASCLVFTATVPAFLLTPPDPIQAQLETVYMPPPPVIAQHEGPNVPFQDNQTLPFLEFPSNDDFSELEEARRTRTDNKIIRQGVDVPPLSENITTSPYA